MTDPRFRETELQFHQWKANFDAGRLTQAQFEQTLDACTFEHGGRFWTIGASSGKWYASEGQQWVLTPAPQLAKPSSSAPTPPAQTPRKNTALKFGLWCLLLTAPLLTWQGIRITLEASNSGWRASDMGTALLVLAVLFTVSCGLALFKAIHAGIAGFITLLWIAAGFAAIYFNLGRGFAVWWWPDTVFATGIVALAAVIIGTLLRRRLS